jgi:hypothetical protein
MDSPRTKIYLLLTALLCFSQFTQAQVFTIKGIFFRKSSDERIASATVTDLKTQQIMMSDELGGFNIPVSKGDTLLFKKTGYTDQKQGLIF